MLTKKIGIMKHKASPGNRRQAGDLMTGQPGQGHRFEIKFDELLSLIFSTFTFRERSRKSLKGAFHEIVLHT